MQTYTNTDGIECVSIKNEDGTTWSGFKSAYDKQQEALSTPMVSSDAE